MDISRDGFNQTGIVRIGTSGIVVPGNKQSFPEAFKSGSRLHYYASIFNTVEINSSFHKLPLPSTFEKWAAEVPDDFLFTVKLYGGISHAKNLNYTFHDVKKFMHLVQHIGSKKGCLLIQFPASITSAYLLKLEELLRRIFDLNMDSRWQPAVEVRSSSWYQDEFYDMLNKYNTTLVFHDIEGSKPPTQQLLSEVIYFRFHGPTGNYRGSYTDEFLQGQANLINHWVKHGKEIYVYFNNTMGSAYENARLLQKLTKSFKQTSS